MKKVIGEKLVMIESARRSLEMYIGQTVKIDEKKDKSLANYAAKYVEETIEWGSVFTLNYQRHGNHDYVNKLLPDVDAGLLYSSYIFRDNFKDLKNITSVKKNTEEYFDKLYTSQYIIVDGELSTYYVNRKGQTVITVIDHASTETIMDKVTWSDILVKSDIVTCLESDPKEKYKELFGDLTVFSGTFATYDEVVEIISSGKTDFTNKAATKKQMVVGASFNVKEIWLPYILNTLDHIDRDKYEVTLVLDRAFIESMAGFLVPYKDVINIISKFGWFMISEQDRKVYDYINTDLMFMEDMDETFSYVSKELYQREFKRICGNKKYDELVLIGDRINTKNYWINIARAIDVEKKTIFFDSIIYNSPVKIPEAVEVLEKNATLIYMQFDNLYVFDEAQKETLKEYAEKYELDFEENIVKIFELKESRKNVINTSIMRMNDIDYVVYNEYVKEVQRIDLAPLLEKKKGNLCYIVESKEDATRDIMNQLKVLAESNVDKNFYIIDTLDVSEYAFDSLANEHENVRFFDGTMYYYALLNYMDEFVVRDENSVRIKELKDLNKKVYQEFEA